MILQAVFWQSCPADQRSGWTANDVRWAWMHMLCSPQTYGFPKNYSFLRGDRSDRLWTPPHVHTLKSAVLRLSSAGGRSVGSEAQYQMREAIEGWCWLLLRMVEALCGTPMWHINVRTNVAHYVALLIRKYDSVYIWIQEEHLHQEHGLMNLCGWTGLFEAMASDRGWLLALEATWRVKWHCWYLLIKSLRFFFFTFFTTILCSFTRVEVWQYDSKEKMNFE